jgi:hypothetical protein
MGVPPPSIATDSAKPGPFDTVLGPLRNALAAVGVRGPFASVSWGPPEPNDAQWLDLDSSATEAGAVPGVHHFGRRDPAGKLAGYWVLQNLAATVPLVASYLYAAQRRVPVLQGNALLENVRWLNHVRLVQPRFWVLPDDPLRSADGITVVADEQALITVLLAEVERTYAPIIAAFRARRQVASAHGWASVVDGLHKGFMLAGRNEISLDAAWELWQTASSTWSVAARRWPRRLQFVEEGRADEMVVRAACCLIYTIPNAAGEQRPYCANCPLDVSDEDRIHRMLDRLRRLEAEQQAVSDCT